MKVLLTSAFLCLTAVTVQAASVVVTGVINSPPSTSVTCTPVSTSLTYPVPTNSPVCPIAIQPAGWSGTVTVSDTTHWTTVTVNGVLNLETGATSPPAGPFSVTVTTTP